ncbi:hypothetical protein BL313_03190 [Staphylococcus hominis]|uniref:hypothetical protein n=1 Tax=Staphylococcus hominis TaxID=1290 RepID=UPI0008FFFCFF|nr:hypothetical protein [Staphylococcus hominis]OJH01698.1 hypothetical protein BL313_03190 [Staphylococcus hominis]
MKDNTEQLRAEAKKYFDGNEEVKKEMEDNYIHHSEEAYASYNMVPPDEEEARQGYRDTMERMKNELL